MLAPRQTGRARSPAPKQPQLNLRIGEAQLRLIDEAAAALHKNRTEFLLEISLAIAEDVLLDRRLFSLDDDAHARFIACLDAPVADNPRLRALLHRQAPWEA